MTRSSISRTLARSSFGILRLPVGTYRHLHGLSGLQIKVEAAIILIHKIGKDGIFQRNFQTEGTVFLPFPDFAGEAGDEEAIDSGTTPKETTAIAATATNTYNLFIFRKNDCFHPALLMAHCARYGKSGEKTCGDSGGTATHMNGRIRINRGWQPRQAVPCPRWPRAWHRRRWRRNSLCRHNPSASRPLQSRRRPQGCMRHSS